MNGGAAIDANPDHGWGVVSEHGRLLDVLVCAPDNFRWLPTSAISRATLERGRRFDPELARRQHAKMGTLGGGGAHCLAQALRRERLAGA